MATLSPQQLPTRRMTSKDGIDVLRYTEDNVVSTDLRGAATTSVFDAEAGLAPNRTFVKVVAWYDNEWGCPNKVLEIDAIDKVLARPRRPMVAIVAGAKVSTKLTILQSLAKNVDRLSVGGGIANTFMLAAGLPIGKSLAEPGLVDEARAVIEAMRKRGAGVPIPVDVVTAKAFKADAPATVKRVAEVAEDDLILDIGPQTAALLARQLAAAGTIVWNGPVGVFEFDAFAGGTEAIARVIAASSAFSIAGGGDTLAAITKYGIEDDIDCISTGGGAFLEVLEGKTLPAFEILSRRAAEGVAT